VGAVVGAVGAGLTSGQIIQALGRQNLDGDFTPRQLEMLESVIRISLELKKIIPVQDVEQIVLTIVRSMAVAAKKRR
jgi:hypothetical protein